MKSMREQILDAVELAGAIAPEDLQLAFSAIPEKEFRDEVRDMIDYGELGVDLNWNFVLGDGVALWP